MKEGLLTRAAKISYVLDEGGVTGSRISRHRERGPHWRQQNKLSNNAKSFI